MKNELRQAIRKDCYKRKINDSEQIKCLQEQMISLMDNEKYNFCDAIEYNIFTQQNKKRKIASMPSESLENYLTKALSKIVNRKLKIEFANRNKILLDLFDCLKGLSKFKDYTIVRFDFKHYFDSLSTEYIYKKYLIEVDFTKEERIVLEKYISSIKHCRAGLPLSNTLAEIIGRDFDRVLQNSLKGIMFYARYVDDGILILNTVYSLDRIKDILNEVISIVFYDTSITVNTKNKALIDFNKKFACLTYVNGKQNFDYLGYKVILEYKRNDKLSICLGISDNKINKYRNKTKSIILKNYKDYEKLRIILKLLSRRVVYTVSKNNDVKRWVTKGITYNYKDLFFFGEIDYQTEQFLKSLYTKSFTDLNIKVPDYLRNIESSRGYNLYYCLMTNKAFILDEIIGSKKDDLIRLVEKVNKNYSCRGKSYHELIKELLIDCAIGY